MHCIFSLLLLELNQAAQRVTLTRRAVKLFHEQLECHPLFIFTVFQILIDDHNQLPQRLRLFEHPVDHFVLH